MKHLWVFMSLVAFFASPIYAAIPTGKVQTSSQTASRWKEYAKDNTGTWYYDRQTVKPEIQDLLTSPAGTIPVIINGWTKIPNLRTGRIVGRVACQSSKERPQA
jgi:hypothetical protein